MCPLLQPSQDEAVEKIAVKLPQSMLPKMAHYLAYAQIKNQDDLIKQTLNFVMEKDKGFKTYLTQTAS